MKLDENYAGRIAGNGAGKFIQWAVFYVQGQRQINTLRECTQNTDRAFSAHCRDCNCWIFFWNAPAKIISIRFEKAIERCRKHNMKKGRKAALFSWYLVVSRYTKT